MTPQGLTFVFKVGAACLVERMTATSTTSPKRDHTTDLESEREIQNALDKRRKKRKSVHVTDASVKQLRLDCKYERIGV